MIITHYLSDKRVTIDLSTHEARDLRRVLDIAQTIGFFDDVYSTSTLDDGTKHFVADLSSELCWGKNLGAPEIARFG